MKITCFPFLMMEILLFVGASAHADSIASGEDIEGVFSAPNYSDSFTISVKVGQAIRASLGERDENGVNDEFDPQIQIYSPSGSLLVGESINNSGVSVAGVAAESGEHVVVFSDVGSNNAGAYRASVVVAGENQISGNGNFLSAVSGTDFEGEFLQGNLDVVTISVTAGGTIRASLGERDENGVNDEFDPQIQIYSPSGSLLVGESINNSGVSVTGVAAETGEHVVVFSDVGSNNVGAYRASVVVAGENQISGNGNFLSAVSGSDFEGEFAQGDLDVVTINVTAGGTIRASLGERDENGVNDEFDPQIQIYSPSGSLLVGNSINNSGVSVTGVAAESGEHVVVFSDVGSNNAGAYRVSVVVAGENQISGNGNFLSAVSGTDFEGEFLQGDLDVVTISVTAGGTIRASLGERDENGVNDEFDPQIQIYSPSGSLLVGESINNSGVSVTGVSAETGEHVVVFSDVGSNNVGAYRASVVVAGEDQFSGNGNFLSAVSGTDFEGGFVQGDLDVVTINVTAGGTIRASLGERDENGVNDEFDPQIQIYSPSGSLLVGNSINNSEISITGVATESGEHVVVFSDITSNNIGLYRATIVVGGASSLASKENSVLSSGIQTLGSTFSGDLNVNVFPARAGDEIAVSVTSPDSPSATPQFEILDPSGQRIFINTARSTSFIAEESGDYYVIVLSDGSSTSNRYGVTASGFTGSPRTEFIEIPLIIPQLQMRFLTQFQIELFWIDETGTWSLQDSNVLTASSFGGALIATGYPGRSFKAFIRDDQKYYRLVK